MPARSPAASHRPSCCCCRHVRIGPVAPATPACRALAACPACSVPAPPGFSLRAVSGRCAASQASEEPDYPGRGIPTARELGRRGRRPAPPVEPLMLSVEYPSLIVGQNLSNGMNQTLNDDEILSIDEYPRLSVDEILSNGMNRRLSVDEILSNGMNQTLSVEQNLSNGRAPGPSAPAVR